MIPKIGRLALRLLLSLCLVAAITFVFARLIRVNTTTVGFFYLLAILLIAAAWGLIESTVSSVAAMLCFNFFFLPPVGALTVADPQNWLALFAFLATSLIASQLSALAKRRTQEAVDRQLEMERLYALSRALLLTDTNESMARQIAHQIARTFEFPAVVVFDRRSGERYEAGPASLPEIDSKLREAVSQSAFLHDADAQITVSPIRLGGEPIGSLALKGPPLSDAALQSVLNLAAVGLEKARAQQAVNRAEVARQSEELKSTLLDAIAHEFKTPLTSIKAVTTDLLDPAAGLADHQRELVRIADEGTDRLERLVTEAIQLARIEGGKFGLNKGVHFPSTLISGALRQMKALTDGREIRVQARDDLPLVSVDAELIQTVVRQLVDNSLKYSQASSPITVCASASEGGVIFSVADQGPGISEEEQSKIFEKFYRGAKERLHTKGTGMGLNVIREILRAHGSDLRLRSELGQGSEFSFFLPIAPREKTT